MGLTQPESVAERKLVVIADSLGIAINVLESRESKRLMGGAATSLADYLRTIKNFATTDGPAVDALAVEPQSLRVPDPKLYVIR